MGMIGEPIEMIEVKLVAEAGNDRPTPEASGRLEPGEQRDRGATVASCPETAPSPPLPDA